MKILVTGFEPFGGEKINPSMEAVKLLNDEINGSKIIKLEIPTVMIKSVAILKEVIEKEKPNFVLNVGQAGGRKGISIERIAINIDDFRIEDNEGNRPIDEPIIIDGPAAYFSTLPIKAMLKKLLNNNIVASISNTAGTFVCNHVAYSMSHLAAKNYPNMKTGFIHVPFLDLQTTNKKDVFSMDLDSIVKSLRLLIEAIIDNEKDIKMGAGEIH